VRAFVVKVVPTLSLCVFAETFQVWLAIVGEQVVFAGNKKILLALASLSTCSAVSNSDGFALLMLSRIKSSMMFFSSAGMG